jgi:hypothetical protein
MVKFDLIIVLSSSKDRRSLADIVTRGWVNRLTANIDGLGCAVDTDTAAIGAGLIIVWPDAERDPVIAVGPRAEADIFTRLAPSSAPR